MLWNVVRSLNIVLLLTGSNGIVQYLHSDEVCATRRWRVVVDILDRTDLRQGTLRWWQMMTGRQLSSVMHHLRRREPLASHNVRHQHLWCGTRLELDSLMPASKRRSCISRRLTDL